MKSIRLASDRGKADYGWLKANYTFSFAHYYDPRHMGFRAFRVMNNDTVMPDSGFPTHPHRDMEIITFILDGSLEHKDTIGSHGVIHKGEIQVMSAGTGIAHSEFNPSSDVATFLYQIWIEPDAKNYKPYYGQVSYEERKQENQLTLLVDNKGQDGVLKINRDIELFYGQLKENKKIEYKIKRGHAWIQVFKGKLEIDGQILNEHDGMAISQDLKVEIISKNPNAEFLLFDLD